MSVEAEDVRRRLYTPPVMIRLELHHPEDEEPRRSTRGDVEARDDADRAAAATNDETGSLPPAPPSIVDRGCLVPCFPGCHAPVYRAGHVITGHLLVRPLTRLLISGERQCMHAHFFLVTSDSVILRCATNSHSLILFTLYVTNV